MARKHEEVGIIGIIGAGPGRPSTKIQTTHCRLHTSAKTPLQTVKVQAKVEMARMESTW